MKIVVVGPPRTGFNKELIGLCLESSDFISPDEVPDLYPYGAYAINLSVVRKAVVERGNAIEIRDFETSWGLIEKTVACVRDEELQIIVPAECCRIIEGTVH